MIMILSALAYFGALYLTMDNIQTKRWSSAAFWMGVMIFTAIMFGNSI